MADTSETVAEQIKAYEESMKIVDPGQTLPEPEAPTPAASTPAAPDQALLARASQVGLSPKDVQSLPPEALKGVLESLERQPRQPTYEPEPQSSPDYRFDPYTGKPLQQATLERPKLEFPKLDPEKYDPEFVRVFEQQNQLLQKQDEQLANYDKKFAEMDQRFQEQGQAAQQRQAQAEYQRLETTIAKDEDFADVFGVGAAHTLVGTRFYEARRQVAATMDGIRISYERQGLPAPDLDGLYNLAKSALHGSKIAEVGQSRAVGRAKDASGRFISKPTSNTRASGWESLPKGADRAVGAVAALMRNGKQE